MGSRIANMLPADRPNDPGGQKVKIQLFQSNVMQIFCPQTLIPPYTHTHTDPWNGIKTHFFPHQNKVMLHIKLNEITKCSHIVAIFCPKTLLPKQLWGSKAQYSTFSEDYHVPYIIKFNGITNATTWQ